MSQSPHPLGLIHLSEQGPDKMQFPSHLPREALAPCLGRSARLWVSSVSSRAVTPACAATLLRALPD